MLQLHIYKELARKSIETLNENETSNENYIQEKDADNKLMLPPDLSKIASNFVILNLSPNYRGRSIYFIKHGTV